MKRLWLFDPLTLKVDSKIDLGSYFTMKEKSQMAIYAYIKGRMIVFDHISGVGVVFNQRKIILKFKEHIDWTYAVGVCPERQEIQAIVAGYHENRQIKYDVKRRKVKTLGIKEYDLAHKAIILDSASACRNLIFESQMGIPVAVLYLDSNKQDQLRLASIPQIKFNKLFNLEKKAGVIAGVAGSVLALIRVNDFRLSLWKVVTVSSLDDDTPIEHVEALDQHFLLVCTRRSFYRVTVGLKVN